MSDFVALSADASLWELAAKARGVTQLLSSGGEFSGVSDHAGKTEYPLPGRGMDDVEKPWQDMAILLIVLSLAMGVKGSLASLQCGHIPTKPASRL